MGSTNARAATVTRPIVVSTWEHGFAANKAAWEVLSKRGRALDAVEAGVRVAEADPKVRTVGYGGRPDRDGRVTVDASVMDEHGNCGSVAYLQNIKHAVSIARRVMERTEHVLLAGQGALEFALSQGFQQENLLTEESEKEWREWLVKERGSKKAQINIENHDTICTLAVDFDGNLAGACTSSGAAWKVHGRVGDSSIIGAGLFVDNDVGAACATGWGEAAVRVVGSHLVVELMRQGVSPEEACRLAVERVAAKNPDYKEIQVGFLALNKSGVYGSYCIQPGFDFAVCDKSLGNRLLDAKSKLVDIPKVRSVKI